MTSYFRTALFALVLSLPLFTIADEAGAYCINNNSTAAVHVQALDAPGFEADIKAGDKTCCDEKSCLNRKGSGATLLAVTGYVPVKGGGRPGWKADCRAKVSAKGTLDIMGDVETLTCKGE